MSSPLGYADLANKNNELIRKGLEGSLFMAPFSADPITTLTTGSAGGLNALPTNWDDCGWMTTDGVDVASAVTSSDIDSWGSAEPTRSDITKKTTTIKVVLQETKALTLGLVTFVDASTLTADATTGEVDIEEAPIPSPVYYRALSLAVDQGDAGEIYVARFFPRVKVTDLDDEKYANGSDAIEYGATLTAFLDPALGYSAKRLYGGPGWKPLAAAMGF